MVISPGEVEILKFPVFSCWELETDPKGANHRKTSFAENWGRGIWLSGDDFYCSWRKPGMGDQHRPAGEDQTVLQKLKGKGDATPQPRALPTTELHRARVFPSVRHTTEEVRSTSSLRSCQQGKERMLNATLCLQEKNGATGNRSRN